MNEWIVIGVVVFGLAFLGDRWLAKRGRVPLSHSKPKPRVQKDKVLGMEATDTSKINLVTDHHNNLELQNQGYSIFTPLIAIISRIRPKHRKSEKK